MSVYFNTTNLSGPELRSAQSSAKSQEAEIAEVFRVTGYSMTPSQVHWRMWPTRAPITSIRRAMSNLTLRGVLVKLDAMRMGPLGKKEHYWEYARSAPTQTSLFEEASQ